MDNWTIAQAEELYGFRRWGGRHVGVDATGCVTVYPAGDHRGVRLLDVIREARAQGLRPPLTIRFQDLLRYRVKQLNEAFRAAIKSEEYPGQYRGVFPIKVNQLREVVEEILDAGEPYNFGIEAGSKPELMIALALHTNAQSLVICNGYKDPDYIRLALMGRKLGKEIFLVIEQHSEIDLIVNLAKEIGVEPLIGFRVKLSAQGEGKWAESSGDNAKFGLSSAEMVDAARRLRKAGLENSLRLVHFHIGSQVPNILTIKKAVIEAARFYVELARLGFPMKYLDVGGGLGIDYDGSRSAFESSMNYGLEEYARDVVFNIKQVCDEANVAVPDVVSESGRALVAPHSILVMEVFDRISKVHLDVKSTARKRRHPILKALDDLLDNKQNLGRLERFHDAQQKKEEAYSAFTLGYLDLETRAEVESIYWKICDVLRREGAKDGYQEDELRAVGERVADQYVANFSVFQSLIDHWACDQLFPVAPLHRLDERPTQDASIVDITCDSEGKIAEFIDLREDVVRTLPLHPLNGEAYYLGVFLVGAYQDIMGDLHNLFGRVNEVHVYLEEDESDGYYIEESIPASTVDDVLRSIQYRARDLSGLLKKQMDKAIKEDRVKPREGVRLIDFYDQLLRGDTYLQPQFPDKPRRRASPMKTVAKGKNGTEPGSNGNAALPPPPASSEESAASLAAMAASTPEAGGEVAAVASAPEVAAVVEAPVPAPVAVPPVKRPRLAKRK